jgi:S-adenosylmethionine synthetase
MSKFKTAESISPKHPDKLCDRIADAILDAYLIKDPDSRVAIEVAGGHHKLFLVGEVTSEAKDIDIDNIIERIAGGGFEIIKSIVQQSPEIARGVDIGGAGDQGIMVGYANSDTAELLPLELALARDLNKYLYKIWPYDGKTQITIVDNSIQSVVASFQKAKTEDLKQTVVSWQSQQNVISNYNQNTVYFINPSGDWQVGGFDADSGLTGRKLVADAYGPRVPTGGGALAGKDPSKVDRSATYIARRIAIDYLKRFNAHEVYVTLAYAIGVVQPVQAEAIVDGHSIAIEDYDLSPQNIINYLNLKRPIYEKTSEYGQFGNKDFSWER